MYKSLSTPLNALGSQMSNINGRIFEFFLNHHELLAISLSLQENPTSTHRIPQFDS